MNKSFVVLLGSTLLFTGFSPAMAQVVKVGEGVRAASEAITKGSKELTEASKTVSEMSKYALRLPSSIIDAPQGVSYLAKVQQFTFANLGEQFSTLSTAQKINFYQNQSEIFLPLSKEQVKELVADAQKRTTAAITDAQKDYLYLSVFPEQVIKGGVSSELLSESLFYNRGVLLQGVKGGAEEWGKQMAAITNLGLFGEAKDARLIVDTAKQITGPKEMLTDIVTFRALSNLEAYDKIQELANLRISASGKLSYVWHDFSQYMAQNGYPLEIPSSEIYPVGPDGKLNETLEKALVKYNPYNLFNGHAGSELTAQFKTLRTQLQTELARVAIEDEVKTSLRMEVNKVKPVEQPKRYESPFASFRKEEWELPQTPRVVETPQRAPVPATSAGWRPSYNELYYKALDLGLPRERIETLDYKQLAFQVNLTENMLKSGKIYSRYDEYMEVNKIAKEEGKTREASVIEWAKAQPDFFAKNYAPGDYTVPFNENAKSIRVLMINDDPRLINDVLTKASNNSHFTFETKENVLDAFALLEDPNNHYDIILTDFNTNAGNPLELAMFAYKKNIDTKFVIYSLAGGTGPWLYQYNIMAQFGVYEPVNSLLNFLSNIAVTGRAFPQP